MIYQYTLKEDLEKDAMNWWSACNEFTHGNQWQDLIDKDLIDKLTGISQAEGFKILKPIIEAKYSREKDFIENYKKSFNDEFKEKFILSCEKMEKIIGKPLYRNDFTFYITTIWRCPYDQEKGYIWTSIYMKDPISVFLHELCHFQFIYYWRENHESLVSKLTNDQFEFLKESLTIILDEEFFPLIDKIDEGFDSHQEFRSKLIQFWAKNKNFDELVNYGLEILSDYV